MTDREGARRLTDAARLFLDRLSPQQRATASVALDDEDTRREWSYLLGDSVLRRLVWWLHQAGTSGAN